MITLDKLSNGLQLVVEEVSYVESVAFDLLIPGGIVSDPDHLVGASLVLMELTTKGAGKLNSRELSDAFDRLGIRRSEAADHEAYLYHCALLSENLGQAFELVSLMAKEATLPEAEITNIKSTLLQDLAALKDNPAQRAMNELQRRYYPAPYSRSSLGEEEGIKNVSLKDLQAQYKRSFNPQGSILSVAGKVSFAQVKNLVESHFSKWAGAAPQPPKFDKFPQHAGFHISTESAQEQIALAYPSAPFGHKYYYAAKLAAGVLSGGMFGRLFVEVREKRGLCYSVYARHSSNRHYGTMTVYAGTTPERAAETLSVISAELKRLKGTITEQELTRAKASLLTALVIGEESSSARSASNAFDLWLGGRIRTLDEIEREVNNVSLKLIDEYLESFPSDSYMLLTLGPKSLT